MTDDNPAWYQTWFDTPYYHILYQDRDVREAEFFLQNLIQHLPIKSTDTILDVACGRGRHALYLAEQGLAVTGLDLSPNSIAFAKNEAIHRGLNAAFYEHDMRTTTPKQADILLNLFTSIGYFEDKDDNTKTIKAFYDSLIPGGLAVIDFMHVPLVKRNLVADEIVTKGEVVFTIKRTYKDGWIEKNISFTDNGTAHSFQERVAALELHDFRQLLESVGFSIENVFGNYSLTPFVPETAERLILIARK